MSQVVLRVSRIMSSVQPATQTEQPRPIDSSGGAVFIDTSTNTAEAIAGLGCVRFFSCFGKQLTLLESESAGGRAVEFEGECFAAAHPTAGHLLEII